MRQAYWLSGLKLESDFPLPALVRWEGSEENAADVAIHRGKVPARLERPDHAGPIFQTRGRDEYLLNLPGTGRILVRNGNEITVDLDADGRHLYRLASSRASAMNWRTSFSECSSACLCNRGGEIRASGRPIAAKKLASGAPGSTPTKVLPI
jgi:hypothetical protein